MAVILSARQAGSQLGLEHAEVIRRIRKGHINASKMGWSWVITQAEVEAVKEKDWYKNLMKRRSAA